MKTHLKTYLKIKEQKAVKEFVSWLKSEFGNDIILIRLFGSKVKGNFDKDSDIDILIIVKDYNAILIDKIANAQVEFLLKYSANLSPVVFSKDEYQKNMEMGSPFFKNIDKESISL